jgi:hypothetical protein
MKQESRDVSHAYFLRRSVEAATNKCRSCSLFPETNSIFEPEEYGKAMVGISAKDFYVPLF